MPTDADFHQAILLQPADDGPRLVYADWLDEHGDPRGAFLRLQVELARLPEDDPARPALASREADLLAEYRNAWLAPLREWLHVDACPFVRGCLQVDVSAERFVLLKPADLRGPLPVQLHVHCDTDKDSEIQALLRARALPWLAGLSVRFYWRVAAAVGHKVVDLVERTRLTHLGVSCGQGPDFATALADSSALADLTSLDLGGNLIGAEGVRALASSPHLRRLTRLNLNENRLRDTGVKVLAGSPLLARLQWLSLTDNNLGGPGVQALLDADCPALRALRLGKNFIGDRTVAAVINSPLLSQLTELELGNDVRDGGATALADAPAAAGLRMLGVGLRVGEEGANAILRSPHLAGLVDLQLPGLFQMARYLAERLLAEPHRLPRLRALFPMPPANEPLFASLRARLDAAR